MIMAQSNTSNVVFFVGAYNRNLFEARTYDKILFDACSTIRKQGHELHDYSLEHTYNPTIQASIYKREIEQALRDGKDIYLIELADDLNLGDKVHHIRQTEDKTVYLQVVELLKMIDDDVKETVIDKFVQQYNSCAIYGRKGLEQIGASALETYVLCSLFNEPCELPVTELNVELVNAKLAIIHYHEAFDIESVAWCFWNDVMNGINIPNLLLIQGGGRSIAFLGENEKSQQVQQNELFSKYAYRVCFDKALVTYMNNNADWQKRAVDLENYVCGLFKTSRRGKIKRSDCLLRLKCDYSRSITHTMVEKGESAFKTYVRELLGI